MCFRIEFHSRRNAVVHDGVMIMTKYGERRCNLSDENEQNEREINEMR